MLTARSTNCFATRHILHHNGIRVGTLRWRGLSGSVEIRLRSGSHWLFRRVGFLPNHYTLEDQDNGDLLARCRKNGWFTRTWKLSLAGGLAEYKTSGLWGRGAEVRRSNRSVGRVTWTSFWSRQWQVAGDGFSDLSEELTVGLLFHTLARLQQAAAT